MTTTGPDTCKGGGHTDIGRRKHNEDSFLIDPELGLYVVADGVGGHKAGEVASNITCQVVRREVAAGTDLAAAVLLANREVSDAVASGTGKAGMASTVVAAVVRDGLCDIAWVGDSRAYLLWRDRLSLVSRDHSYVEAQLAAGRITPEEALTHPRRNVILQAIGLHEDGELNVGRNKGRLQPGSRLLLCSDGISDPLDAEQLAQILMRGGDPEAACERLVALALQCGGKDNATAVLVDTPATADDDTAHDPPQATWTFDSASGSYDGQAPLAPREEAPHDPLGQTQIMSVSEAEQSALETGSGGNRARYWWLALLLGALALALAASLQ